MFRRLVVNGHRTIVNDLLTMMIKSNMTERSRRMTERSRRVAYDNTLSEGTAKADGMANDNTLSEGTT